MRFRFWLGGALAAALIGGASDNLRAGAGEPGDADLVPGPIHNLADLQDTAQMLFKIADTNLDHQISKKEAVDAGNLLVGGFFFRADANGDGTLTREEAKAARDSLTQQRPWLGYVLQKAMPKAAPGAARPGLTPRETPNRTPQLTPTQSAGAPATAAPGAVPAEPYQVMLSLIDSDKDQKIQATELRQGVQGVVDMLYTLADSNQDGQLTPAELNNAVGDAAQAIAQAVFQTADADKNGTLSLEEYENALKEPAHAVFRVLDGNNDNQISLEELEKAQRVMIDRLRRLRVPEPANSFRRQLQSSGTVQSTDAAVRPAAVAPASATVRP